MSDPFLEIAEFTGRACGTIVRDVAEFSKPLSEAFQRGWQRAWEKEPASEPVPSPSPGQTDSAVSE